MVLRPWHGPPNAPPGTPNDAHRRRDWSGGHTIDLRASLPLPGGSWYVTIVAGRERRSHDRLQREGQTQLLRQAAVYVVGSTVILWLLVCATVCAYLLKSALQIDLFEGPSPLHFLYERLFENAAVVFPDRAIAP